MVRIKSFKIKGAQNNEGNTAHGRIQGLPDKRLCLKKLDLWHLTEVKWLRLDMLKVVFFYAKAYAESNHWDSL
jgi:hypothetical protein